MNARIVSIASALMISAAFLFVGCSSESGGSSHSDTFTDQVVDEFVETTYASAQVESVETELVAEEEAKSFADDFQPPQLMDILKKDHLVYVGGEEGLLVYNTLDDAINFIPTEKPVTALVDLGEKILVGGDKLYTLEGYELSDEDYQVELAGTVTDMYLQNLSLFIGTTEGLYVLEIDGIRRLADNIHVSAIASDGFGVWVGTAGDGLYRWNGDSFRKRYLKRDTTLFDNVTALDYKHNHLYLGTDKGFFIFDGGRWTQYRISDGLPSETITAVNAGDWVIKIGTTQGPVTFFENQFKPVTKLEGMVVTGFLKYDGKLLAATTNAGLVMKSGGLVTTLFEGDTDNTRIAMEERW